MKMIIEARRKMTSLDGRKNSCERASKTLFTARLCKNPPRKRCNVSVCESTLSHFVGTIPHDVSSSTPSFCIDTFHDLIYKV